MEKKRIAIIGRGHVGSTLARGLAKAGYAVQAVGRDRDEGRKAIATAELVFLALPHAALDAALADLGDALADKTIVDVTNPIDDQKQLTIGFSTSGAEELQKKLPRARVVKAFNAVFAQTMDSGRAQGRPLTLFVAGDHAEPKQLILALAKEIGFDPIDAGPLHVARLLEPLSVLNIRLGRILGLGTDTGFVFVR